MITYKNRKAVAKLYGKKKEQNVESWMHKKDMINK